MPKKKSFVTGATGQDGSYIIELLLEKGYEVHGLVRRSSVHNTGRIDHLLGNKNLVLHYGDVTDSISINNIIRSVMPDEVYNLAAQSHVRLSFDMPQYTASVDGIGTLNILEAVRQYCKTAKVYQASTSELFGGMLYNMPPTGYTEESPLHPRSPYGCAKMYGLWITRNYKEAYGIYACNGILFNHESIRRGENFVTKKITNWVHEFHTQTCLSSPWNLPPLKLGNLHAKRDWGHAKDYVEAMWLMLQQENPQDFVVATNETYTVKNFVDECISQIGWSDKVEWIGSGVDQKLIFRGDPKNILIEIDPDLFRPSEVDVLLGDASKAKLILGWIPKYTFKTLVADMLGTKNNQ